MGLTAEFADLSFAVSSVCLCTRKYIHVYISTMTWEGYTYVYFVLCPLPWRGQVLIL